MTQSIGLLINEKSVYNNINRSNGLFLFYLIKCITSQVRSTQWFCTSKTILYIPAMNLPYTILCSPVGIYIRIMYRYYVCIIFFLQRYPSEKLVFSRLIQIFIARLIILFIYNCEMLTPIYLYITLNYIYILQVYIV